MSRERFTLIRDPMSRWARVLTVALIIYSVVMTCAAVTQ